MGSDLFLDLCENCKIKLGATSADTVTVAEISAEVASDLRPSAECKIVSMGTIVAPEASSSSSTASVSLINDESGVILMSNSGNLINQSVAHALTSGPVDRLNEHSSDRLTRSLILDRASYLVKHL